MATQTQTLNLVKPDYTDTADIDTINDNMDILDDAVGDAVTNIAANSGTSETFTVTRKDGTTFTFSLNNSGATAGTYGPSANVNGIDGATISVPQITVDAKGRVTSVANRTYTSVDNNTTYSAGTGLSLSDNQFSLANSGVAAGSYGPSENATPAYGATFNVPYITVDAKGRVTSASTKTVKIPASDNTDTKYSAASGGGLSLSGTAFSLANSGVTAGSYGPSANATPAYGATFNVPYFTVDAKGRVTAASTKTVKIPASDNTNTWRGIQDNLTSTSTTDSLSAYQGKLLYDKIKSLTTTQQISVSYSLSGSEYKNISFTAPTVSGYTVVAISQYVSGSTSVVPLILALDHVGLKNMSTGTQAASATLTLLYIRNS